MVSCNYCNEDVALPYTCSLCGNRHCGKHRLAESHECPNIGAYKSPEYAKKKLRKNREMQAIKAGNDPNTGQSMMSRTTRNASFGNFWTASSTTLSVLAGGLLLGLVANIRTSLSIISSRSFLEGLAFFGLMLVAGAIGMNIVYQFRKLKAEEVNVVSDFVIWPIGIVISLITGLIGFTIYAFGFFTNSGSSLKSEADVAKNSIYSFAGLFISLRILAMIFSVLFPGVVPILILSALVQASRMFLWFGLLMMIPWGQLDGSKLYNYDSRDYWMHLIGMIILIIISFF